MNEGKNKFKILFEDLGKTILQFSNNGKDYENILEWYYVASLDPKEQALNCLTKFEVELNNRKLAINSSDLYEYLDEIIKKFTEIHAHYAVGSTTAQEYNFGENHIHYDDKRIITAITNEGCMWSKYVVDVCMEKIREGENKLVPGENGVPKNLDFSLINGDRYYSRIGKILVLDEKKQKNIKDFKSENYVFCVEFEIKSSKKVIVFALESFRSSKFEVDKFYINSTFKISSFYGVNSIFYQFESCSLKRIYNNEYAEQKEPYLRYYEELYDDLVANSKQIKMEINIDLLRNNYNEFANLFSDSDLIVLPIIGETQRLKNLSVTIDKYSDDVIKNFKYNFYDASVSMFSKEHLNANIESLKQYEIVIPKGNNLILLDIVDLSNEDKFLLKKILCDENTKKCYFEQNVEGEKNRINRIISGIEDAMKQKVINKRLVNSVCLFDIRKNIPVLVNTKPYSQDDTFISYLKQEYKILSKNDEQLTAIDKILQMDKFDIDFMLVQGPPGTGKTELILSLAKELTKRNYNTLITSNVHVACDNIAERLKDNKEIVLKRYTTANPKLDKYHKEHIENVKRYVENQVLADFVYDGKSITSKEVYDFFCEQKNKLINTKKEKIKFKKDFEEKLSEYDKKKTEISEIENIIKQESLNLDIIQTKLKESESKIIDEKKYIEIIETKINDLKEDKSKIENEINIIKNNVMKLETDLSQLVNQNIEDENKIKEYKDYNDKINKGIEKINQSIQEKNNFLTESSDTITKLKSHLLDCAHNNPITFTEEEISLFGDEFLSQCKNVIRPFIELRSKLMDDYKFIQCNQNVNLKTLEYVSNYALWLFQKITENDVKNLYSFYKKNIINKILMLTFNAKLKSYFKTNMDLLNEELRGFLSNYNYIVTRCIDEFLKTEISSLEDNLKKQIAQDNKIIKEYENYHFNVQEFIEEDSLKIKTNTVLIQEKAKRKDKFQKYIESKSNILLEKTKILSQYENEKQEECKKNSSLKKEIESTLKKLDNVKKKLSSMENRKNDIELEIDEKGYSDFIDYYNQQFNNFEIDIAEIDKEIENFDLIISHTEERIHLLTKSGWKIEDAFSFVFSYVQELENIVKTDDDDVDSYFNGSGDRFKSMFDIPGDRGSLISMTTSQVASLLGKDAELTFDYAIIDEASKCKFEDIIISLPKVKHLVLIGDFMQLDPMYDEYDKIDKKYQEILSVDNWNNINKSLFGILLKQFVEYNQENKIDNFTANPCVAVMKKQYRMNKGIFNIIKPIYAIHKEFELVDGKQMTSNDFKCIEIDGNELVNDKESYRNDNEADTVVSILTSIKENIVNYSTIKSIGIITGYRAQENVLHKKLRNFKIPGIRIQIGTFDRFQGREYDLVIVSLVRTKKLGFTNNVRRMNVAFSRAKSQLIVLGNFTALYDIAKKVRRTSAEECSTVDAEENNFVVDNLIPKLYKLKQYYLEEDLKKGLSEVE